MRDILGRMMKVNEGQISSVVNEFNMNTFIKDNRAELVAAIKRAGGKEDNPDNAEIRLWILNDEGLYNWARSEGMRESVGKNPYKAGDKVMYKDGDQHVYTVYAVYGDNEVSLSLKDYDDVEQDYRTPISKIKPASKNESTKEDDERNNFGFKNEDTFNMTQLLDSDPAIAQKAREVLAKDPSGVDSMIGMLTDHVKGVDTKDINLDNVDWDGVANHIYLQFIDEGAKVDEAKKISDKKMADTIIRVAYAMHDMGQRTSILALTKRVMSELGIEGNSIDDYKKVAGLVRDILSKEGWDIGPMAAEADTAKKKLTSNEATEKNNYYVENYKGKPYKFRDLVLKDTEGNLHQYLIATGSLEDAIDVEGEDEDLDQKIYFYVNDEDINKTDEEILRVLLDSGDNIEGWKVATPEERKEVLGEKKVNESSDEERDAIWDYLIEYGIATESELQLVTNINGFTKESLESVIYAKTGYRNLEQLKGENEEDDANEAKVSEEDKAYDDDSEGIKKGEKLIDMLGLKVGKDGRVNTSWGTKTPLGLYRTLKRVIEESKNKVNERDFDLDAGAYTFKVTYEDTYKADSEEEVYDKLLSYLGEVVANQDVTGFGFRNLDVSKPTDPPEIGGYDPDLDVG